MKSDFRGEQRINLCRKAALGASWPEVRMPQSPHKTLLYCIFPALTSLSIFRFSSFKVDSLVVLGEGPSPAIHDPEGRFGCLIHLEDISQAEPMGHTYLPSWDSSKSSCSPHGDSWADRPFLKHRGWRYSCPPLSPPFLLVQCVMLKGDQLTHALGWIPEAL